MNKLKQLAINIKGFIVAIPSKIKSGVMYLVNKYRSETPKIYLLIHNISKYVCVIISVITSTWAIGTSGLPSWYEPIYPYLILVPGLISGLSKFKEQK